jgi:hypothetical protein
LHVGPSTKEGHHGTRKPKSCKSLFIGAKNFMHVAKKGDEFLIYVLPTSNVESPCHEIPSQYKGFKDVFLRRKF